MKEGEINPLFSSFLYYKFLDTDIEKIRKYCYDLRDKDNGRNISNIGGWQSNLLSGEIPELNYETSKSPTKRTRSTTPIQ